MSEPKYELYAIPHTNITIRCYPHQVPSGYIKVNGTPPDNEFTIYIIDEMGNWILPENDVNLIRHKEYLKIATYEKQIEALIDAAKGDLTSIKNILNDMDLVRQKYPKVKAE